MQGVLNSLNGATITNASVLDGLNLKQAQLLLTTKGLSAEKQKELLVNAGLMASEDKVTLTLMKQAFMSSSLGDEEKERALIKLGLIDRNTKEAISEAVCTKKDIEALVAQGLLNEEQKEGILAILGLDTANKSASVSLGLFTKGIWANIKAMAAWMISNPLGWITLLGSAIAVTMGIIDLATTSVEEHREQLSALKSEYADGVSELDGLNNELKSTQDKIQQLESKGTLTFAENEELNKLRRQNTELERSISLLELQNKVKKQNVNKKFVETMGADIEQELYTRNENGEVVHYMPMSGQTATDDTEADYIKQRFKDLEKLRDELSSASTKTEKDRIRKQIENIENYFRQKNNDFSETAEGIDYIQKPTTADDRKVNEWLDYINDFQDKMAIAMDADGAKENAFKRLVDNWKFDELLNPLQELGAEGKVTAEKLKDPAYAEFISKLQEIGFIADDSTGSLKFVASAFNGVTDAARNYINQLKGNKIGAFIDNLSDEAKALGVTESALADLVAEHILFNNTGIDTSSKQEAFRQLAGVIAATKEEAEYLLILLDAAFNGTTLNLSDTNEPFSGVALYRKDTVLGDIQVDPKKILKERYGIGEWLYSSDNDDDDDSKYKSTTKDNSSKKNEPLDNYLEYAESLYKVHQDEAKYINDLQWAYNNLTKDEDERLKVTEKINEAYRDMADNRIKDLEHQIEMTKNLKGENTDVIAQLNEIQRVSHEEADRLRAMGYDDNSNEIQELQKQWWDAEKEKLDWRLNLSKDWIDQRNTFGDWKLFNDNEVNAWERVIKWLKEEYPHAIEEIKEAEESLFEARKEQLDKLSDFGSSYLDSQKTLLQAYYDTTNAIKEAHHEINKELETSKTIYEWLDEDTRKLLFNQEDYNALSEELYDIQYKADKLQRQYQYDLENSTLDTIEEITSNYEMQYEMLMKSYEIAKADLEVAKKKAQLNNVLNERNVRMFINGQWQWVANTQDVMDAKAELADAEYAQRMAKAGLTQQESINNLTEQQNHLGIVISRFESGVIDLDTAVDDIVELFGGLPSAMQDALNNIGAVSSGSKTSSKSGGLTVPKGSSNVTYGTATIPGLGNVSVTHVDGKTQNHLPVGSVVHTSGGDYKITGGTAGNYTSEKVKKYATGTKYTKPGISLIGEEEPEILIDNNGHLSPINQPTLGNFGAGGVVFNQDQMTGVRELWDLSNIVTPSTSFVNNAHTPTESFIFSGDINVYNPTDAQDVADNVVAHIVQGLKLQRKSR